MSKKKYNKLVRDKIPNVLIKTGKAFKAHKVEGRDLKVALSLKVLEEAKELNMAAQDFIIKGEPCSPGEPPNLRRNHLIEEIGDLLEVTFALIDSYEIEAKTVKEVMARKAKSKGKFKEGIFLDWVEETTGD